MVGKTLKTVLLGAGGVGGALLGHILSTRESLAAQGIRIEIVAVFDSTSAVLHPTAEIDDDSIGAILEAKRKGLAVSEALAMDHAAKGGLTVQRLSEAPSVAIGNILQGFLPASSSASTPPGVVAVVDCTASDDMGSILAKVATSGACIVLANKKPITSDLDVYDALHAGGRNTFRCEATCGAGLPILCQLQRMADAGDPITCISGALSGTMGYVMSKLQEGETFSSVVASAKALGYTEPDPREDLSGMDVARKALILARHLGWRLNMADIEVESLYPSEMAGLELKEFMESALPKLDDPMRTRVEEARAEGNVLRYVATVRDGRCRVGVTAVPINSPLGNLRGTDNLVEMSSRCYKSAPLVIQGAGAGTDTTAAAVLADVVDLASKLLAA